MARWQRRTFTSVGLTQVPPGPYIGQLAKRSVGTIKVTRPNYDNIGAVLTTMGVTYEPFDGAYDCDLLFMNCGTADRLESRAVQNFVENGGCLYASDLTSAFVSQTFPQLITFGATGVPGSVAAQIVDPELQEIVGRSTTIHFDMSGWSIIDHTAGDVLVEAAPGTAYAGHPLLVGFEYGQGAVFYTSFHNRAQASEQERLLLQLLVLKQIGAKSNTTLEQASRSIGFTIPGIGRPSAS
jgi:hypothetical protein